MNKKDLAFPDRPVGDVEALGITAIRNGGVTLVAKRDAEALIRLVVEGPFDFKGFEAFTVLPDDSIQPHLRWSCDWPKGATASVARVMALVRQTPDEVTHFEFYFRDAER